MSAVVILSEFELITTEDRYEIVEHRPTEPHVGKTRVFLVSLDGNEIGWAYERLIPVPGRPHLPRFTLDAPNGMSLLQDGGDSLYSAANALKAHRDWKDSR